MAAKKLYLPRGPVCEKMCNGCPFRPDGKGMAVEHEDYPAIVAYVQAGGTFYCHETVIMDPRTTFGPDRSPLPVFQPHFEECKGSVLIHRGELLPPKPRGGRR